jgi:hypothetical protein
MTLQEAKDKVAQGEFLGYENWEDMKHILGKSIFNVVAEERMDEVAEIYANSKVPEWLSNSENRKTLIPSKERIAVSDMVMKILTENCTVVDGQVKGVIIHGAVEKLTDIIMDLQNVKA